MIHKQGRSKWDVNYGLIKPENSSRLEKMPMITIEIISARQQFRKMELVTKGFPTFVSTGQVLISYDSPLKKPSAKNGETFGKIFGRKRESTYFSSDKIGIVDYQLQLQIHFIGGAAILIRASITIKFLRSKC
ncbi:uncharacterized protein LOC108738350 isoform X3 [Agrilus planipennis]|uniref:Uncharacterized protein LOC108738350 isoform X3 n=1 Tax=Agrilus planipennis TaxID=224129 RepID=A0A1W4X4E0_AGRPL|nr:uncharacterized protein LOC108738350 isoform X3 [Agrilus planipennis]